MSSSAPYVVQPTANEHRSVGMVMASSYSFDVHPAERIPFPIFLSVSEMKCTSSSFSCALLLIIEERHLTRRKEQDPEDCLGCFQRVRAPATGLHAPILSSLFMCV
jgi:hypothetical protein